MLLRSNFSFFPHYFIYIFLTSGAKLHIHLLNVIVQFIVFLTLSTLICRGTDISKYFSESLGIRDNDAQSGKNALFHMRTATIQISMRIRASVQSDLKILCQSTFDSVSGQRRPRSACANAQADLGLRCPQIAKKRPFRALHITYFRY